MRWRNEAVREAVWEFDIEHVFAAAVIGDAQVMMVIAHVDPSRSVIPLRWHAEALPTGRGYTPSLRQIEEALKACWARLSGEPIDYSRFFLCLPPWCTQSRRATGSIHIPDPPGGPDAGRPRVTEAHIRELAQMACREHVPQKLAAIDVQPLAYVLDNGCRVADPVGSITSTLAVEANLVLADSGLTAGILGILTGLGIRVDVMTTPYVATAGFVDAEDLSSGCAQIDVGRSSTCCSFFQDGAMVHTALVPGGSENVVDETAECLGIRSGDLRALLAEKVDALMAADDFDSLLLPLPGNSARSRLSVGELDAVLVARSEDLFRRILETINALVRDRRVRLRRIQILGEDRIVLRALHHVGQAFFPTQCSLVTPDRVFGIDEEMATAFGRMIGLLRRGALGHATPQPYLDLYNRVTPADPAFRVLVDAGRHLGYEVLAASRDMAGYLRVAQRVATRASSTIASRMHQWFW